MTLTFDLQTWVLSATLRLIKVNISTRLFENPSITNKVMLRTSNSQYWKCDLNLWPWPLADQHGSCARHTVWACLTFLPRDLKIHAYRTKWCSGQAPIYKGAKLDLLTLNFNLDLWPRNLVLVNGTPPHWGEQFSQVIWKSVDKRPRYAPDKQNLTFWPWIVTLTFDLGTWFLWMALPLIEVNTSAKLFENPFINDRDKQERLPPARSP